MVKNLNNNILAVTENLTVKADYFEGYQFFNASSAHDATKLLQEETIGVILIDWDAFRSQLTRFKDWLENPALSMIPIIVIGECDSERIELIQAGADYVFVEPYNWDEISACVDRLFYRSKQFEQIAFCDALTGVFNRRYFDQQLRMEIDRAKRNQSKLSLALIDIDRFKQINDTYGHPFGDVVLQGLGQFLSKNLRPSDFLARLGGEEFALLFPETEVDAGDVMRRILQKINVTPIAQLNANPFYITFSCGVVQWSEDMSPKQFLEGADSGLYRAKQNGRNRIELYAGKLADAAIKDESLKTVLIVDDEEKERSYLAEALDINNIKVRTVSDGHEALQFLAGHSVDLCIIDDLMPKLDGLSLLKKIKIDPRFLNTKTLMLQSKAKSFDMIRYLNAGADDCMSKPVSTIELEYRVRFLLGI